MEATYLGIDIGGTSAKHALVSASGELTMHDSFSTGHSMKRRALLERLEEVVRGALERGAAGVGVSTLGVVDAGSGRILGGVANMPCLKGLDLAAELGRMFPDLPVAVYNDVQAVARAERWLGAAKGCSDFFCITLGTGLGGCAFVNGKPVQGAHFRAGEICYLDYQGEQDYLEHRLSTGYVMGQAARDLGVGFIDGIAFFDRVRGGDRHCRAILSAWIGRIARLIANIVILLDPEKVILGGGISTERELLLEPLRERVDTMLPTEFAGQTVVEMAACANTAGMLGAVSGFVAVD